MRYRRTNTAGLTYNTSIQVADLLKGDTRFGGSKAGYINTNSTDSSLVVWSSSNGVNAYSSYNLYTPVGVDDDENGIPLVYSLEQNYPNPFNPSTTIKFSIPEQTNVTLKIFNSIGQEVASLLNGEMAAGNHSVDFNASKLSSGVYFYRIDSPSFTSTKKMILIK
ncbi:MAG: T9SS type A sorting domain-containing protein [Ignavibacteriales bacterium]|nr:T9SS type A sorting domain-containing protein [Ignavibacteriales bacterium]